MHSFSETGAGVPAFLAKLWRLVEDPETNNLICWSKIPLNGINCIQNSKFNSFENNKRIYLPPDMDEDFLNKLFNDSEILGSYGLNLANDSNNDKKGSELMAYQPMYDLSDIINDQNDLDADVNVPTTSASKQEHSSSVLNTPYHE